MTLDHHYYQMSFKRFFNKQKQNFRLICKKRGTNKFKIPVSREFNRSSDFYRRIIGVLSNRKIIDKTVSRNFK